MKKKRNSSLKISKQNIKTTYVNRKKKECVTKDA